MADDDDYEYEEDESTYIGKTHFEGLNFDTFLSRGQASELSFEEKFEYTLERNILLLDFEDGKVLIQHVMNDIKDIPYMKFKNPLAFLFGYYVVQNKKIDESRVKICMAMCKRTLSAAGISGVSKSSVNPDEKKVVDKKYGHIKHITEADIIRYARLIIQINNK